MPAVQYIACTNNAGFRMDFQIQFTMDGQHWATLDWNSGKYDIDQTRTSPDLSSIGVPTNAAGVRPVVHAEAGKTESGSPPVTYSANGQTATYEVRGVTQHYSVNLIGGS